MLHSTSNRIFPTNSHPDIKNTIFTIFYVQIQNYYNIKMENPIINISHKITTFLSTSFHSQTAAV